MDTSMYSQDSTGDQDKSISVNYCETEVNMLF